MKNLKDILSFVSIPLKSGHIVIDEIKEDAMHSLVSIPLKSGHIVILKHAFPSKGEYEECFNPLKIGSYCNF